MIQKILKILNDFTRKDEICGHWSTDDGSGFSMIFGSWIKFKPNGTGKYSSWHYKDDELDYSLEGEFHWKRNGEKEIEIKEIGKSNSEIVNYKIERIDNRFELSNLEEKIVGKTKIGGFWNFSQIMFKY